MIAILAHEGGARITLSAQRARNEETAIALLERNRVPLEKQGMKVDKVTPAGDAATLEAHTAGNQAGIRQIYFVRGSWGFVLTLTAPPTKMTQFARDLELAWHSIRS
jgi:hypothetical protein